MIIFTGTDSGGTKTMAKVFGAEHEFRGELVNAKLVSSIRDPFVDYNYRLSFAQKYFKDCVFKDLVIAYFGVSYFLDSAYLLDPDIKVVVVLRNGKDCAVSYANKGRTERSHFGYNNDGPIDWRKMEILETLSRGAWIWRQRYEMAFKRWFPIPNKQKMIFRIEDLDKDYKVIEKFTGLKADKNRLGVHHKTKDRVRYDKSVLPVKEDWTDEMNAQFDSVAGDLMNRFGY